jgi:hypothetical protein
MAKRKSKARQSKSTKDTSTQRTESTGLGDSVEKLFKATGVDKVAKFILGEDCGCDGRRDALNKAFPYKKKEPKCLTEDEYNLIKDAVESKKRKFTSEEQRAFISIYERVFSIKIVSDCTSCGFNSLRIFDDLKVVYNEYKDE